MIRLCHLCRRLVEYDYTWVDESSIRRSFHGILEGDFRGVGDYLGGIWEVWGEVFGRFEGVFGGFVKG